MGEKIMINRVEFTVKGDYESIGLRRNEGSNKVELMFVHYRGCSFMTCDFADLKKAVEILEGDSDDK